MHTTTALLRTITVCVFALMVFSADAQTLNAPDLPVGFSLQYGASAVDPSELHAAPPNAPCNTHVLPE